MGPRRTRQEFADASANKACLKRLIKYDEVYKKASEALSSSKNPTRSFEQLGLL